MSNETARRGVQTQSIVVEYEFRHPPEKVWRALTETDLIASWLMPNDFRAEVGIASPSARAPLPASTESCIARFLQSNRIGGCLTPGAAGRRTRRGYGAELDTVVTWTLTSSPGGGTRLRLDHDGFTPDKESTFNIRKRGWTTGVIPSLGRVLDGMI